MAIDSAQKRKSIVGIHVPYSGPGVTPDATPDSAWRQAAGYSYSGITAASVAASNLAIALTGAYVRSVSYVGAYVRSVSLRGSF